MRAAVAVRAGVRPVRRYTRRRWLVILVAVVAGLYVLGRVVGQWMVYM